MKKPRDPSIPSRAEQREIVLKSEAYLARESFTRIDASRLLGLTKESAANLLSGMAKDGLLAKRLERARQGGARTGITVYQKPPPMILRKAWRKHSDLALGIQP